MPNEWAKRMFLAGLEHLSGGELVVQCPGRTYAFGQQIGRAHV